jgi:hypothetical protein
MLPTEPIGSNPRLASLIQALRSADVNDPGITSLAPAIAKFRARVAGPALAATILGGGDGK